MCMQCVAQGAPYVLGSVVGLKAMAVSARRGRRRDLLAAGDVVVPVTESTSAAPSSPGDTAR